MDCRAVHDGPVWWHACWRTCCNLIEFMNILFPSRQARVSFLHRLHIMRRLVYATVFLLACVILASANPSCDACRKLLGVDSQSLASDIKKAYHQKALASHPDKNPDDPEAQEKFLRIGSCYEHLRKNTCSGDQQEMPSQIFYRLPLI